MTKRAICLLAAAILLSAPVTAQASEAKEEYVDIVCTQLEYLRPEIVINRITGDPKADDLIEPFRPIVDLYTKIYFTG